MKSDLKSASFKISVLLFLSSVFGSYGQAQVICGSTNIFAQSTEWMRSIARDVGVGYILGDQEFQCGLSGEDFRLCRRCEGKVTADSMDAVRPMLSRFEHRSWIHRWHTEFAKEQVKIKPSDFRTERSMGHVRAKEEIDEFERRMDANWGESFLFAHRQVQKMMQLEMTVQGKPCFGARQDWPKRWDDPDFLSPMGEAAQKKLDQVNEGFRVLDAPGALHKDNLSLNQLGQRLAMIKSELLQIYADPKSTTKNCQGDELSSGTCDDLLSTKSAHVNPRYWEIQSYLDSFVGKWLRANGYEEISLNCRGRSRCYEWQGSYTASYPF